MAIRIEENNGKMKIIQKLIERKKLEHCFKQFYMLFQRQHNYIKQSNQQQKNIKIKSATDRQK